MRKVEGWTDGWVELGSRVREGILELEIDV